jgi:hypothetical protein
LDDQPSVRAEGALGASRANYPKNGGLSSVRPIRVAKIEDFTILVKRGADKISLKGPATDLQNP